MLSHSFDRFYIVTKFELPKTKDLKLATFGFDFECSYVNHTSTSTTDYARLMNYFMKIAPYAQLYHRQIQYYNKTHNVQRNQIHHLEDSMIMYGVYNSDTLKDLIDTVHRMQNFTTWNEKTFAGKLHDWMELYS